MSWSVNFVGQPKDLVIALGAAGNSWDGHAKIEYEAARPILISLVQQNFATGEGYEGIAHPMLHLEASGHGYIDHAKNERRNLFVKLEPLHATLVVNQEIGGK